MATMDASPITNGASHAFQDVSDEAHLDGPEGEAGTVGGFARPSKERAENEDLMEVVTTAAAPSPLDPALIPALRAQIQAFRYLGRGAPLPGTLASALEPPTPHQKSSKKTVEVEDSGSSHSHSHHHGAKDASLGSAAKVGADLLAEALRGDKLTRSRINARVAELESLPSSVSSEPFSEDLSALVAPRPLNGLAGTSAKIKAVIELKAMRLLEKQRRLREEVSRFLTKPTVISTALDRRHYVFNGRHKPSDVRQPATSRFPGTDRREKISQADFLASITQHSRELKEAATARKEWFERLGNQVVKLHQQIEKEEATRLELDRSERLRALRENDEETYLRLVKESKDTRVQHIMSQTNDFLRKLTDKVAQQQDSVAMDDDFEPMPDQEENITTRDNSDFYGIAHRIVEPVTRQPAMMQGGELKEYQLKGLQWMVSLYNNKLNGILADEMGLGKTIQTIALLSYLYEVKKQHGPFLIIVPLSTMTNWSYELEKWAPALRKVVMKGTKWDRKNIASVIRSGEFDVVLTTFEYIILEKSVLSKVKWIHMIIDEGHRMKNAGSKLVTTLTQYYTSRYRLILTGTPLQNNLPELWALLNFICPKIFASSKTFEDWFNSPFAGGGEKLELNEEESLLIIRRLHQVLRPFLLRRLKKDVASDLPDKVEHVIRCGMSALQKRLYNQISKYGFLPMVADPKRKHGGKSLNNPLMHLRKICNHPYAFPEIEAHLNPRGGANVNTYRASGKFELLDRILPKLFRTGHRVLMFFQMKEEMNILEDYLRWRGWLWLRLDGNSKGELREEALANFNAENSPYNLFILTTRAGGLGLNLQAADTVIIFDSDWNPHQDLQAQDRAHRIGQKKQVLVLRLITSGTVEEEIQDRAHFKLDMDGKVIQAGKFDDKSSAADRENVLKAVMERAKAGAHAIDVEGDTGDEELNDILQRSEEELDVFRQVDLERIQQDIRDWAEYGGPPKPKYLHTRLMQDDEVPELYRTEHKPKDEIEKIKEEVGRGHRQRKEIVYDDNLTEKQFMDAMEKLEEEAENERAQRKRKRKSGAATEDPQEVLRKRQREAFEGSQVSSVAGDDDRDRATSEGPGSESAAPLSESAGDMDDTASVTVSDSSKRIMEAAATRWNEFVREQDGMPYSLILKELRQGSKESHYMWYCFPQHRALGQSFMAKHFGLSGLQEAKEYLAHAVLGPRLRECTEIMLTHGGKKSAREILGPIDAVKFKSSMTLFGEVEKEPGSLWQRALDAFYDGKKDDETLKLLSEEDRKPSEDL